MHEPTTPFVYIVHTRLAISEEPDNAHSISFPAWLKDGRFVWYDGTIPRLYIESVAGAGGILLDSKTPYCWTWQPRAWLEGKWRIEHSLWNVLFYSKIGNLFNFYSCFNIYFNTTEKGIIHFAIRNLLVLYRRQPYSPKVFQDFVPIFNRWHGFWRSRCPWWWISLMTTNFNFHVVEISLLAFV